MTAIQAIHIRGWQDRPEPKPHVVFRIEIQASVRSWQMWRRYSEFADLHLELTKACGAPPPAPLPPKHAFSFLRSSTDPALLEARRAGLEQYLRAILAARDDVWRAAFAFRDFLGVPSSKPDYAGGAAADAGDGAGMSAAAWLEAHQDAQTRVRDVRADINRRDALADAGDVNGAHGANVQAKKRLAGALQRVGALEAALPVLAAASGMAQGELQRRTDMAARLRDDCERLARIVTVARMTGRGIGSAAERNPAAQADRDALLGSGSSPTGGGMPGGFSRPVARVFGQAAPPKETEQTRPLDNHGLVQLQQTQMDQQDSHLAQLSTILSRQRMLGLAINQEIREQNEELDDLTNEVDRVGASSQVRRDS
ncbi:syntaxin [Epithele typhae]|uniref:syntaxin n=1 Tax=Epithele typhae TaxID=378194 RepID=UPI00200845DF|nr:syntaxin [Epithele typhae]KAH9944435.1 syntaxin [Epithele typhae]